MDAETDGWMCDEHEMDIQTPTAFFLHQIFTISHRKCVPLKSDDKKLHEVLLLSLFSKINDERFMCLRCSASSASLVSCERPPEGEQMNDREKHGPQNGSAKARCTIRKRRVYKLPLAFRLLLLYTFTYSTDLQNALRQSVWSAASCSLLQSCEHSFSWA
jgi:hypothetical protein